MRTAPPSPPTTTVPFCEKAAYASGDLAFNLIYVAVGSYLAFFYTDVAGIPAATVGTILLVARLLDGAWDLVVGVLIERTRSRLGKARPWLLYLALPYGLSAVLLFTAPAFGPTGKIIYAFVTYTLCSVILYTALNIPYGVLNSLMTADQTERGLLNTFRMIAAYIGAIIVSAVTLPLVEAAGGGARSWTLVFGLYGILSVALIAIVVKFCTERVGRAPEGPQETADAAGSPDADDAVPQQPKHLPGRSDAAPARLTPALRSLLSNKYWLLLVVFGVLMFTGYNLMSVYPYYAKHILGDESMASVMFTFRNVIELAGVFVAIPFIRRIGKRNVTLGGCLAVIVGQLIIATSPTQMTIVLLGIGVAGLGEGAMFGVVFAMIADTIEYEQWRSGARVEGLVYAGATFGQKVGGALGGVAVGWMLGLGGYVEGDGGAAQPQSALDQITVVFIWLPLVFAIAMAICMAFYRLDKEYPQIIADLRAREGSIEGAECAETAASTSPGGHR